MLRFKYYISQNDLILVASGHMDCVKWLKKKPKSCRDSSGNSDFVAVYMTTTHPLEDGKDKRQRTKQKVEGNRKKRQAPRKTLSRNTRNRNPRRSRNTRS